jgi:hypothetical protein
MFALYDYSLLSIHLITLDNSSEYFCGIRSKEPSLIFKASAIGFDAINGGLKAHSS